jgi:hypothetical protein
MKLSVRYMRVFYAVCVLMGVAGAGLTYIHRFIALRLETIIREASQGQVRVDRVAGNLLEGMLIRNLEFSTGGGDRTRILVRLPSVRVSYDLIPMLFGKTRLAPSRISLVGARIEVERRGAQVELHRLAPLFALLRRDLRNVPITIDDSELVLSGEVPWASAQTVGLDDGFLEWSSIGLAYRVGLQWAGHGATARGSYDPASGIGHLRWKGDREYRDENPLARLAAVSSANPTAPGTAPASVATPASISAAALAPASSTAALAASLAGSARLTGRLHTSGEVFLRTQPPGDQDSVRSWARIDLEKLPSVYVAWNAALQLGSGSLSSPSLPVSIRVVQAAAALSSGAAGDWSAELLALDGSAALRGKLRLPLSDSSVTTAAFSNLRPSLAAPLAVVGPEARVSGSLDASSGFPWPVRLTARRLRLPRLPAEVECLLEGQVSPERVRFSRLELKAGKATASGTGELTPLGLTFVTKLTLRDLPPEWLAQFVPSMAVAGAGVAGTVEARGCLFPWTVDDGKFELQARSLTVGGISAGDLRALGKLRNGGLELESLEGLGKASLFSSFRLAGRFEPGKVPELKGTVQGLRLEGLAPGIAGTAEATVKFADWVHEIHAKIKDFSIPAADVKVPALTVELVPRQKAEALEISLPGRGRVSASVLWNKTGPRAARISGSFQLPDVSFLLTPGGFLRGGKAAGSFEGTFVSGQTPELTFRLTQLDLTTQRGPLVAKGAVSGALRRGRWVLDPGMVALAGGTVTFEGVVGAGDASWDFKLGTADLPVHFDMLPGGGVLSGRLFSWFQLSGALNRPTIVAEFDLAKPKLRGALAQVTPRRRGEEPPSVLDKLRGKATYRAGRLSVERLVLTQGKQDCTVSGQLPVDLSLSPFLMAWGKDAMNVRVLFPRTPLSVASLFVPWLPAESDGEFQADVAVSGTPAAPRVQGLLMATARQLSLPWLPVPLTAASAKLVFTEDRAEVRELQGRVAGGSLTGRGSVSFSQGWKPKWDVDLALSGVQVSRKYLSLSNLKVQTHLGGHPGKLELDTGFTFDKGTLDLAIFDGPAASDFFSTLPGTLKYRIRGNAGGNFLVRSSAVNAELQGALVMTGRGPDYKIGGELNAVRGQLYFQGHRFAVESGTVSYRTPPAEDLFSWQPAGLAKRSKPASVLYITARGSKEIGRTKVYIEIGGPVEHMNFSLRSLPMHTEGEILAILATGSDAEAGLAPAEGGVSRMITAPLSAGFDEQFLNRPVGNVVRRATGLDEFRIDTNLLQSDRAHRDLEPKISAGKYLGKNIFLSVDGRVGADKSALDHLGVQYNLENNLAITLDKSLETKTLGTEDLSRGFRPDETRFGMEYKLRW